MNVCKIIYEHKINIEIYHKFVACTQYTAQSYVNGLLLPCVHVQEVK